MGHVISCTNNLASTFEAKFKEFEDSPTLYQSLLGSSGILGTTIGAISGGTILKIGRKNTFILASVLGLIGSSLSLVESMTWILSGRLIYGVGCGIFSIVGPRFIEETVPDRLLSLYSPLFMCSVAFGSTMALLMGAGLPDDNNPEALKNSDFWRSILGLPILLNIISVLSMIFYVKYDSIRYLVFKGDYAGARAMIK
jgi:MFS family permease